MNGTFSNISTVGGVDNDAHSIGKIGDTDTVFDNYNPADLQTAIGKYQPPSGTWIGTHCWPKLLPTEQYNTIINISTSTYRSRVYRWVRTYNLLFKNQWDLSELNYIGRMDKLRETAKNYLAPFNPVFADNIINIEFADIVDNTVEFQKILKNFEYEPHISRWRQVNYFLYDPDMWNNELIIAYHHAEVEANLHRPYLYE